MASMRAFRIAYDGRPYYGFQRQPDVPTVEDEILSALRTLDVFDPPRETPASYAAAGRTDAGVSAVAQTVAFEAPDWLSPRAFDSELPSEIHAWASAEVSDGFHATHDASSRSYRYVLYAPTADEQTVGTTLQRLAGTHDFHNLTPDDSGTRRTLETEFQREGDRFVLTFRAGGFARQLVRRLVSVVAEIARGDAGLERIERVLSPEPLSGPEGVAPAPPYPLVLSHVTYPDCSFEPDPHAVSSAREYFTQRRIEYATRARTAGLIADGVGEPEKGRTETGSQ